MDSFGVSSTTDGRGVGAVEAPLVLVLIAVDEAVVVLPNPPSVVLVSVDVDAGGNVLADCAALALRRHTPTALTTSRRPSHNKSTFTNTIFQAPCLQVKRGLVESLFMLRKGEVELQ